MNTNYRISGFTALVLSVFIFGVNSSALAQRTVERTFSSGTDRRAAKSGVVNAANRIAYQVGKDFAMAVNDAKYMKDNDDSFNYTIVDLVYLIDELEGQAECTQLQAILKGIVRGTKDQTAVLSEIAAVSKTFLARQTAEQKWYYNVGTTQMCLMIAGWNKDAAGATKNLKELQNLSKLAPLGTPGLVLEALKGLSKYTSFAQLTVDDFSEIVNDAKLITTLVYA